MLDNGMDLMIYQLRDKTSTPILYFGSITQHDKTTLLTNSEFSIQPGEKWTSKKLIFPIR